VDRLGLDSTATIFAFAGQLIHRKGIDTLMEAHRMLVAEGIRSELVVAGGGPLEADLKRAVSFEAIPGVHFTGFLQPNDLPELFAGSDCFVLPSRSEGWGLVVSEAMAAGTPVISSDQVNAGLELIQNNESGFLFRAGDAMDLARAMRAMVAHPDRQALLGQVRRAVVEETVERAAIRFVALVEAAVRGERIGQTASRG
jgi:glycosyltransferase involved in cell wall biosynthesis